MMFPSSGNSHSIQFQNLALRTLASFSHLLNFSSLCLWEIYTNFDEVRPSCQNEVRLELLIEGERGKRHLFSEKGRAVLYFLLESGLNLKS